MARILLIIAAVIIGLMLLGPIVSFAFTLLKWALILGAVAFAGVALNKWYQSSRAE
ncbi:hypothetical protein [Nonomuraea sp. NPDC046570]|uniref:hypothetical protein n=1 Tax=Nonomuraea sp. NPDC046570 TaxID=3155255 RepID=UPI0033F6A4AC